MTEAADDILDVALKVAQALEAVGARYFVGGSLASSIHGEPRATNDIDFVIDIRMGRVNEFIELLGADFEVDADMLRDAVQHGSSANAFYLPLVLKIDFFGHAYGPFDEAEFARCRPVVVRDGRALVIKSPEDTIIRKLMWFRDGGEVSDRQWRDILGVFQSQKGALDIEYLNQWANTLKLSSLLERAMLQTASE
jgi:hypothetical protein